MAVQGGPGNACGFADLVDACASEAAVRNPFSRNAQQLLPSRKLHGYGLRLHVCVALPLREFASVPMITGYLTCSARPAGQRAASRVALNGNGFLGSTTDLPFILYSQQHTNSLTPVKF